MPTAHHALAALIATSVAACLLLGHLLVAVVVIVVSTVDSLLWDLYVADLIGDALRPYVQRLRSRHGLPSIEESPTRRERLRRRRG